MAERRRITVELSRAEALALVHLAECASNTFDDAISVLDAPQSVAAGYRAIDRVNATLYGPKATSTTTSSTEATS